MDEDVRLSIVRSFDLGRIQSLDAFEAIAALTAKMLRCPAAAISVVDEKRSWFLAKTGLELDGIERAKSFCATCIAQDTALIVVDAENDPRFSTLTLVEEPHRVRSYIGVPLRIGDSINIGTLCAMSPAVNAFSENDLPSLRLLSLLAEKGVFAHANANDLHRAISSLKELNRLFKQAEVAAHIGSWRFDIDAEELSWSPQVYAIHGVPPETPVDKHNALLFYMPEDRETVQKAMTAARQSGAPFRFEASIRRPDGQIRRVRAMGERIDVNGRPKCLAGVFLDCTDEFLKTAALQRAAERDPLTGLYNRAAFDTRLASALGDREDAPVLVLLLDLDGFKEVNDTLGHLVGDRLLVSIAERLRLEAGEDVFVARWGGDEFALLFKSGTDLCAAHRLGQRLVEIIRDEVLLGNEAIAIGATGGLAQIAAPASAEELVRRADAALYFGKNGGRGRVHVWDSEIDQKQLSRQKALVQVRTALAAGDAFAAYQPIVELSSGRVVGFEALLRVEDEQGRVVPASDFLPALVEPQISRRVSRFMVECVLREGPVLLRRYGQDCKLGINVSEADLRTPPGERGFVDFLLRRIKKSCLRPENIVIEVTETMLLLDNDAHIQKSLCQLDRAGFTVALDDFGTGFSSLTHLRDFPIRKIKIDRGFVQAITSDHQSRLIIQAIAQLGQSLGVDVVAEGVESEAQEVFLRSLNCRLAQGYRYGIPLRASDWVEERQLKLMRS